MTSSIILLYIHCSLYSKLRNLYLNHTWCYLIEFSAIFLIWVVMMIKVKDTAFSKFFLSQI